MKLLFNRDQTAGKFTKVTFKLWCKIELGDEEGRIVDRYRFDEAILIAAIQPRLMRTTGYIAIASFIVTYGILGFFLTFGLSVFLSVIVAGGVGYLYLDRHRETVFVRDLIHGRTFTCNSVVELARKEAWLATVTAYLRQVMESAKHWDGIEKNEVEPLPKEEARRVILKGL